MPCPTSLAVPYRSHKSSLTNFVFRNIVSSKKTCSSILFRVFRTGDCTCGMAGRSAHVRVPSESTSRRGCKRYLLHGVRNTSNGTNMCSCHLPASLRLFSLNVCHIFLHRVQTDFSHLGSYGVARIPFISKNQVFFAYL